MFLSTPFTRLYSLFVVALLAVVVSAGPFGFCSSYDVRREWRTLSTAQKQSWHAAVLCLHNKPATSNWGGATTRFEQYQAVHIQLGPTIHIVGQFLPWHRHIVTMFNNELRSECGYEGPTPYWNWQIDADKTSTPIGSSPIFDPVHGFGGDGVPGTYTPPPGDWFRPWTGKGCIADGPYKDMRLNVGPDTFNDPNHCLVRGFQENRRSNMTTALVLNALFKPTYNEFITTLDLNSHNIHAGGHYFVGGEMGNSLSSPGDPLFYLHHAQLDRVWWMWQLLNPWKRLTEMGGTTEIGGTTPTTLDYVLTFPGLGPDRTVRELMDASKEPNCFFYL